MLQENNVRQNFLDHASFIALLNDLPYPVNQVVEYLYLSGWRRGEALKLEWEDIDSQSRTVRLRIENSKNKEGRILPLRGRLWEIIQERMKARRLELEPDCSFVFHRNGRPVKSIRKAWESACRTNGLEGTRIHDLRRCAARNLSRAGVPESVAMQITGHKTRSMYGRYRIVDERDLIEATERMQAHLDEQSGVRSVVTLKSAT